MVTLVFMGGSGTFPSAGCCGPVPPTAECHLKIFQRVTLVLGPELGDPCAIVISTKSVTVQGG